MLRDESRVHQRGCGVLDGLWSWGWRVEHELGDDGLLMSPSWDRDGWLKAALVA